MFIGFLESSEDIQQTEFNDTPGKLPAINQVWKQTLHASSLLLGVTAEHGSTITARTLIADKAVKFTARAFLVFSLDSASTKL